MQLCGINLVTGMQKKRPADLPGVFCFSEFNILNDSV
jgi:hypothetical protein